MAYLAMETSTILDITAVALILIFALIAFFRGFLRMLISFLGVAASVVAAILLRPVFFKMYDSFGFCEGIENGVLKVLGSLEGTFAERISGLLPANISENVLDYVDNIPGSADTVAARNQLVAEKCSSFCVNALSVITGFLLALLVVILVISLCKLFTKLPVVGTLDRILGAVFGLALGIIFIYFVTVGMYAFCAAGLSDGLAEALDKTILLKFIFEKSPLTLLLFKNLF